MKYDELLANENDYHKHLYDFLGEVCRYGDNRVWMVRDVIRDISGEVRWFRARELETDKDGNIQTDDSGLKPVYPDFDYGIPLEAADFIPNDELPQVDIDEYWFWEE